MLSGLPYSCLEKEIQFLRLDLDALSVELDMQEAYQTLYNTASTDVIERQRVLFDWKKTRLEALELFARAQFVISEIQPAPKQPPRNRRMYWRKRRPRQNAQNAHATGPSQDPKLNSTPQNIVEKDKNKENQKPPSQVETIVKSIKTEDNKENVFLDILKNMKKEKVDYDENSVLNNNVNWNFIPQLIPAANIKTEVDCSIVKSEINRGRKRKSGAQKRRAKRIKMEQDSI